MTTPSKEANSFLEGFTVNRTYLHFISETQTESLKAVLFPLYGLEVANTAWESSDTSICTVIPDGNECTVYPVYGIRFSDQATVTAKYNDHVIDLTVTTSVPLPPPPLQSGNYGPVEHHKDFRGYIFQPFSHGNKQASGQLHLKQYIRCHHQRQYGTYCFFRHIHHYGITGWQRYVESCTECYCNPDG
jgi:hypothetical protein